MKKFTKILICLLLCVFTIGLTACGKNDDGFAYPTAEMQTIGNGGMVVKKGNYIYFVNGYLPIDDDTMPDNQRGKTFSVGSLVVAKLNEDGTINKNEKDLMLDSYYRTMSNKLCGFNASGLYIFGDYLYFTSACQSNDHSGAYARERVDFNRIKLNKSSNVEKLYTSQVSNSNVEYNYFANNNEVYLLVYEKGANLDNGDINNRLIKVNANNKKEQTISEDVSSAIINSTTQTNLGENIFYVKNNTEIKKYNVFNDTNKTFITEDNTSTLLYIGGNKVFYEKEAEGTTNLYFSNVNNGLAVDFATNIAKYSNTYLVQIAQNNYRIVAITNNSDGSFIEYYNVTNTPNQSQCDYVIDSGATAINVIGFKQDGIMLYYDNNNNIKVINVSSTKATEEDIVTVAKVDDLKTDGFDFDSEYLYFYLTIGNNEYLHRLKIENVSADGAPEMLGIYDADDVPTEENE